MLFADLNGAQTYFETAGNGQPVVFVHGMSLDTRMWDDQFDVFAERFRVIRYDVRAFGQSAPPDGNAYLPSGDLRALLDNLSIDRAHVVGLSMGGQIAIEFAIEHTDRLLSLTAVDAAVSGFERPNVQLPAIEAAREYGVEAAIRTWLDGPLFASAMANLNVAAKLARIVSEYSCWHWTNNMPLPAIAPPANERLNKIEAPTLVVIGERDLAEFHAMSDRLEVQVPNARKVVMLGVGHMSNMEDPHTFNQNLLDFLTGLQVKVSKTLHLN